MVNAGPKRFIISDWDWVPADTVHLVWLQVQFKKFTRI